MAGGRRVYIQSKTCVSRHMGRSGRCGRAVEASLRIPPRTHNWERDTISEKACGRHMSVLIEYDTLIKSQDQPINLRIKAHE